MRQTLSETCTGRVVSQSRSNSAHGRREPRREGVRDVVIARNGNDGSAEAAEERGRPFVLVAASAVGEVAADDDQLGLVGARPARSSEAPDVRALVGADVQVGDVENPRWHGRPTL